MSLYSLEVHLWEFSVTWIERIFFQRKYTLIPGNLVMLPTWLPFHLNFCLGISILKDWAPKTPGKPAYGQVSLEQTLWFLYQETNNEKSMSSCMYSAFRNLIPPCLLFLFFWEHNLYDPWLWTMFSDSTSHIAQVQNLVSCSQRVQKLK